MNLEQSNEFLKRLLLSNKPFLLSRLGIGSETIVTYLLSLGKQIDERNVYVLNNNNGIYCNTFEQIESFGRKYEGCIEHSTVLAEWGNKISGIHPCEQYFINKYKMPRVTSRILEPFYCIENGLIPWSHQLLGKKVLIVNPFVDSMQEQLKNNFKIYKEHDIFLEGQTFVFYKSYVTSGFNHIHDNWTETFQLMCDDISKLDFDIALLGCGGYGLPLSDYIHVTLNKTAIYVGGGLQLLFGVMGKRWENNEMWKRIIAENDTKFIRPSQSEQIKNQNNIEGGCFW
jgi:hypothetical protein